MLFCPECRRQYPDDAEVCERCAAELIPGAPHDIPDEYKDAEWVELYTFPGGLYAQMAMEILTREDIPAYTQSASAGGVYGPRGGSELVGTSVAVFVLEPDHKHARTVIEPMIDEIPRNFNGGGDDPGDEDEDE